MSDCFRVRFLSNQDKDAAFKNIKQSDNIEVIEENLLRIIDETSNANNFVENNEVFIEFEIEVKTKIISEFIFDKLKNFICFVKDCESYDEGEMPAKFFGKAK